MLRVATEREGAAPHGEKVVVRLAARGAAASFGDGMVGEESLSSLDGGDALCVELAQLSRCDRSRAIYLANELAVCA